MSCLLSWEDCPGRKTLSALRMGQTPALLPPVSASQAEAQSTYPKSLAAARGRRFFGAGGAHPTNVCHTREGAQVCIHPHLELPAQVRLFGFSPHFCCHARGFLPPSISTKAACPVGPWQQRRGNVAASLRWGSGQVSSPLLSAKVL